MRIFFILFFLIIFLNNVEGVPVTYKGVINYGGDISSGYVLEVKSDNGETNKTISVSDFFIHHVEDEDEVVKFYFDSRLFKETTQTLPGSVVELGSFEIEEIVEEDSGGGGDPGSSGGGTNKEEEVIEDIIEKVEKEEEVVDLEVKEEEVKIEMEEGEVKEFIIKNEEKHSLTVKEVMEDKATFILTSEPQEITLFVGESKKIDLDLDGSLDILVKLNSIIGKKVNVSLIKLEKEEIKEGFGGITGNVVLKVLTSKVAYYSYGLSVLIFILIVVLVQLGGIYEIRRRLKEGKGFPKVDSY